MATSRSAAQIRTLIAGRDIEALVALRKECLASGDRETAKKAQSRIAELRSDATTHETKRGVSPADDATWAAAYRPSRPDLAEIARQRAISESFRDE